MEFTLGWPVKALGAELEEEGCGLNVEEKDAAMETACLKEDMESGMKADLNTQNVFLFGKTKCNM